MLDPIDPFSTLELQNPSPNVPELHEIRRSPDLDFRFLRRTTTGSFLQNTLPSELAIAPNFRNWHLLVAFSCDFSSENLKCGGQLWKSREFRNKPNAASLSFPVGTICWPPSSFSRSILLPSFSRIEKPFFVLISSSFLPSSAFLRSAWLAGWLAGCRAGWPCSSSLSSFSSFSQQAAAAAVVAAASLYSLR